MSAFEIVEHDPIDSSIALPITPSSEVQPKQREKTSNSITPEQLAALKTEISERNIDTSRFLTAISFAFPAGCKDRSIEQIPHDKFNDVIAIARQKAKDDKKPASKTGRKQNPKPEEKHECPDAPGTFFSDADCVKPDIQTACYHTCAFYRGEQK